MNRFAKLSEKDKITAPIERYGHMVFMSDEQKTEWENLSNSVRKGVLDHLEHTTEQLELRMAIRLICHAINELGERVKRLEDGMD